MHTVTSKDGTRIAYDRLGSGPALILISAGPVDRTATAPLAELLAAHFTVINYDRRGRGDSGDSPDYALDREYEDLQALIDEVGGAAMLYGTSGGGFLALGAATRDMPVTRLALWEIPYIVNGSRPPVPADYRQRLEALLAEDRRGDMVELFLTMAVGMPAEFVAPLRESPFWKVQEAVAPALVYDAILAGDFSLPPGLVSITTPALVLDGGTVPWLTSTAEAVAGRLPNAERHTLTGQSHNVAPDAMAAVLTRHLKERP